MGFEWAYRSGVPPWDIGRPQPAIERLVGAGAISGRVIDVGCGTGENALYLASSGFSVVGVDAAPTAIERAEAKAKLRRIPAAFLVADALHLDALGKQFDTAIDCGLFHIFSDDDRQRFARSLHGVLNPGGRYHLLCFSDLEPGVMGPRRVSQTEIRRTFLDGWRVDDIVAERFAVNDVAAGPLAWLASIVRV
jgi:SAM-dependent methyltransferase